MFLPITNYQEVIINNLLHIVLRMMPLMKKKEEKNSENIIVIGGKRGRRGMDAGIIKIGVWYVVIKELGEPYAKVVL